MPVDGIAIWARIQKAFDGVKIPEIARRLGIEKGSVYKWRDGMNLPALDTLLKISESTGASLHWLITGTGPQVVSSDQQTANEASGDHLVPLEVNPSPSVKAALKEFAARNGTSIEEEIERVLMNGLVASDLVSAVRPATARQVLIELLELTISNPAAKRRAKRARANKK